MKKRKLKPWAKIALGVLKVLAAIIYVVFMVIALIAIGG